MFSRQQRDKRFAIEAMALAIGKHFQNRRENVGGSDLVVDRGSGSVRSGQFEDERHMKRGIVQKDAVSLFTVLAESLAMVSDNDNQRGIVPPLFLQIVEECLQCRIRVRDLTIVGTMLIDLRVRGRRLVRIVWIVKMYPDEAFPRAVTGVAIWDAGPADAAKRNPKQKELSDSTRFSIFVRSLSNGIVQVDAEQKFYLMTRGIPEDEAERLIVTGFFEPALERIPVDHVRDSTRKALHARLQVLHA